MIDDMLENLSSARPLHAQLLFVLRNSESSESQISKLSKGAANPDAGQGYMEEDICGR